MNVKTEMELYPPAIRQGLRFLQEQDLEHLAEGTYPIKNDAIFAKISSYETERVQLRRAECHDKYIDIQCIIRGKERIDSAPLEFAGEIAEDKMKERDVCYFKNLEKEETLILQEGMFAIYFPWDLHRPNCNVGESSHFVKKAVIKISMAELFANYI